MAQELTKKESNIKFGELLDKEMLTVIYFLSEKDKEDPEVKIQIKELRAEFGGQTTFIILVYTKNESVAEVLKVGNGNETPYVVVFCNGEIIYRAAGFRQKLDRFRKMLKFRIQNQ